MEASTGYHGGMRNIIGMTLFLVAGSTALAGVTDDVRCREIGFSRSVENGDAAAFRSFIDPDARFVGGSVRRGVDAVASGWQLFFADGGPRIKWRPQIVEVLEDGRLALTRGPYRMTSVDADGNARESWGTFNSVWRLHDDGQWRVVFDAGSPAHEPPDEATRALLDEPGDCP